MASTTYILCQLWGGVSWIGSHVRASEDWLALVVLPTLGGIVSSLGHSHGADTYSCVDCEVIEVVEGRGRDI